jgi:uncharacterized protein HemX
MTENNKPEWFEITDADEKPALRKVSKSLPASAVLVVALILGVGFVVGQTQNESPASAISATSTQASSVESDQSTTVAAVVAGTVATNKLANPAISKLPTGGDDDDEDDDHGRGHDDDHEDDEDDDEGDDD